MTYQYANVRRRQIKMASNLMPGLSGFESAISGGYETYAALECGECEKEFKATLNYDGAGYYEVVCTYCKAKQERKVDLD